MTMEGVLSDSVSTCAHSVTPSLRRDQMNAIPVWFCESFKGFCLLIFRERGNEGERNGEKHPCVVASCASSTRAGGTQLATQAWALTRN